MTTSRKLQAVIESVAASDGAGVKLRRSLGSRQIFHCAHAYCRNAALSHNLAQIGDRGLGLVQCARADNDLVSGLRPAPGQTCPQIAGAAQNGEHG